MMSSHLPPRPISGGIFLSYQCNMACRHCMYACSPHWNGDWISLEALEQILGIVADKIQPAPHGRRAVSLNHGLHFTGGEPFLNVELLVQAAALARQHGLPSLFVETNGFWCRDADTTRQTLHRLKEAGMDGMLISVNPFTLERVPLERARRAVEIGTEVFGRNLMVYQMEYYRQFRRLGLTDRLPLEKYVDRVGLHEATSRIELLPLGRAVYTLREWFRHYPASAFQGVSCADALTRPYHNHWDNYGNVLPGFCAGLALGNILDTPDLYEQGLNLDEYPVLQRLFEAGVGALYQLATREFDYQERQEGYISRCHLCLDIRRHLVRQTNTFKALQPFAFYAQLDRETMSCHSEKCSFGPGASGTVNQSVGNS